MAKWCQSIKKPKWCHINVHRSLTETRIQRLRCSDSSLFPLWPVSSASTLRPGIPTAPSASGPRYLAAAWTVGKKAPWWLVPSQNKMLTLTNNIKIWYFKRCSFSLFIIRSKLLVSFFTDPADIYSSVEDSGSKDSLDFRHHNYKEMRKVRTGRMAVRPSMLDE